MFIHIYVFFHDAGHSKLKEWISLLSNLTFIELDKYGDIFGGNVFQEPCVCNVAMELFLENFGRRSVADYASLLVIDITSENLDEQVLSGMKPIINSFSKRNMRIVFLVNINKYLTSARDLEDFLDMCTRILPVLPSFASDSIAFGSNGSLVGCNVFVCQQDKDAMSGSCCNQIRQALNDCKDVLKFFVDLQINRNMFQEIILLQTQVKSLLWQVQIFGPLAIGISLNYFENYIEDQIKEFQDLSFLAKYLNTKILILKVILRNALKNEELLASEVFPSVKAALGQVKDFLDSNYGEYRKRFGFVLESQSHAEILYGTLQMLKLSEKPECLNEVSLLLANEGNIDELFPKDDTIIVISLTSNLLHKLQLDRCICFGSPLNYDIFLGVKRSLKRRSGSLCVIIDPIDEAFVMQLDVSNL